MYDAACRRRETRERAFTLVELLVVIAIIGILIALLLPAVQSAREAARRLQCTNNLKQLALAAHNYHTAVRSFPPGYSTDNVIASEAQKREAWGWQVFLLPYIEASPLYDQLDIDGRRLEEALATAKTDASLRGLLQTSIAALRCPSDDADSATLDTANRHFYGKGNTGSGKFAVGMSNYVGVLGLYDKPWKGSSGPFKNNGLYFGNSRLRVARIEDGTSNTFMFGERDSRCFAASWPGVRNPPGPCNWGIYHSLGRVSFKLNSPEYKKFQELTGSWDACNSCTEAFSSEHPAGALFAFCDGSVHFVPDTVEYNNGGLSYSQVKSGAQYAGDQLGVYQKLGIRNDSQAVDLDF
jgi:prepilin-type N-terminal cleavage/methylation domain-containing protein